MRLRYLALLALPACGGNGQEPLPDPTFVQTHTESEVCAAWNSARMETPGAPWTAGASQCEYGTLTDAARTDTVERIDMYRYLVGLGAVTEDVSKRDGMQACAIMMSVNDELDHSPPMSWDCYAEAGKTAAGSSNLAIGTSSPAKAIDLFMRDGGVASLGHRRWVINFDLGKVGLGYAGDATCLGVFDGSGSSALEWVAYPPPGTAPLDTATGVWSFHATHSLAGAEVRVYQMSDEASLSVRVRQLDSGYGAEAIAIEAMGWDAVAGETYRVSVAVPGQEIVVYDVTVKDCGS